ncbi:conserved hypothetical protein [Coccidioides posadasii str. Silveira]|uniref:Uncharacterized protein n=1 Tax=Coccidioides posadasii (strain RMSCC 757 / Silveira) TaxID=443226 RepID=E9DGJ0_COCPS|nr:conserved hypothetical protein [Coccidioides posadasii str. Silveira]
MHPAFGNGRKQRPHLLPSASLEGLEKFVHPSQPWPVDQSDSWKYKPLPELPRRSSSEYSRSEKNLEHTPNTYLRNASSSRSRDASRRYYRGLYHQESRARHRTPESNRREQSQQASIGHRGRWIIRQTSSPVLSHEPLWADPNSYAATEWFWMPEVPEHGEGVIFQHANVSVPEVPTIVPPPSPKTIDSIDPSLIPRPLGVETALEETGTKLKEQSSVVTIANPDHDICLCHSPHPRHNRVVSISRVAKVRLAEEKLSESEESVDIVFPPEDEDVQDATAPTSPEDEKEEGVKRDKAEDDDRRSVRSASQTLTRLYSFSSSTSCGPVVEREEAGSSDTSNMERSRGPFQSSHLSRSSSLPSPSLHPRHPARKKQPAIPPTDYQKFGPEAWLRDKSKSKATARPKPKLRDNDNHKNKDRDEDKNQDRVGQRRRISNLPRFIRRFLPKAFSSEPFADPPSQAQRRQPLRQPQQQRQQQQPPRPPPPPLPPSIARPQVRPQSPASYNPFTTPWTPPSTRPYISQYRPRSHRSRSIRSSKPTPEEWGPLKAPISGSSWRTSFNNTSQEKLGSAGPERAKRKSKLKEKDPLFAPDQVQERIVMMRPGPVQIRDENGVYWL